MPRKQSRSTPALSKTAAMTAANKFCLFHYPTMFTGGIPHRLVLPSGQVWVVPIVLTHPDHGIVGQAGSIIMDVGTGKILAHTERTEVVATGKKMREAKCHGQSCFEAPYFAS